MSFAFSLVIPDISSNFSSCFTFIASTSFCFSSTALSFWFKLDSLLSMLCCFLSRDSSFWITLLSYFCNSLLLSLFSFSASLLNLWISSFASRSFSFFIVSASLFAWSIIFLAKLSASPIFASDIFFLTKYPAPIPIAKPTTAAIIAATMTSTSFVI